MYQNMNRPGTRTSTTVDPKIVLEDIDTKVRRLEPSATPIQTITSIIGRGAKPKSHKIQVMQYHAFDNFDYCSATTMGSTVAGYERMARMTLDQASRPDVNASMYYYPQDKFLIVATGQVVEVWITPDAAILYDGTNEVTCSATLTGNSTTRSLAGTVVVRNIEPYALKPFTTSDVIFLGRTIYESQPIEARSSMRDYVFDCNFVEHKEKVLIFTEDQKNLVETMGKVPDFTHQQNETILEFKKDVDLNLIWGERGVDLTVSGRPKRHLRGLFNTIRTNVSYYDPTTITDFEAMLSNFLFEQGFRYNNAGVTSKMGLAGPRVLFNFNMAFREYRRTTSLGEIGKKAGMNLDTYILPGGFQLAMARYEGLRQNTSLENWMFVIDPALADLKLVKDYNSRLWSNDNERDIKYMIEWQGTVAWHLEQCHALLRTI